MFLDYQNVHGTARRQFLDQGADPADGHVDPFKLAEVLCQRRKFESELKQVRVYRGRPNPERQPGATSANDRQTEAWRRHPKVEVIRRNVSYSADWPTTPAVEKGIDVKIAVDMIHMALMDKTVDAMILFSSDKDLLPPTEMIRDLKLNHIEVATWGQAYRLRWDASQLPYCHCLNEQAYESVRDRTDYSLTPTIPAVLRPKM